MKKKLIAAGIAAVTLAAVIQTSSVFAAPAKETPRVYTAAPVKETPCVYTAAPAKEKSSDDTNTGTECSYCGGDCSFVDKDADGICDNYKKCGTNGATTGKGFVDKNDDGICDNYASRQQDGTYGRGYGRGYGGHHGQGHGGCHRR